MSNKFKIGDIVKTNSNASTQRVDGIIKYIACYAATIGGGRSCDKKTCNHPDKNYVWVVWSDKSIFSYKYDELSLASDTQKSINDKKEEIKEFLKEKEEQKLPPEFWEQYNGFTKVKYDRYGRAYLSESKSVEKPMLQASEIDWDVYNGYKKGPLKKVEMLQ